MVVAWTKVVEVVENYQCWQATRGGQDGNDARRMKGEDGEEVKALSWSRSKKDRLQPGTWARCRRSRPFVPRWGDKERRCEGRSDDVTRYIIVCPGIGP